MTLQSRFDAIRTASRATPLPDWPTRKDRLDRLEALIRENRDRFAKAIAQDFGQRPAAETNLAEVFPVLDGIRDARHKGRGWMRQRRAGVGLWFQPARAALHPMPLGVVGIVAPWNYPLMLSAGPLTSALVAGNRAMLKLSEHAPAFAEAFADAISRSFAPDEVTGVTGGPEVAADFTALPFDHLLFTGSTNIGRKVMAAAAPNLTPVTLELGGKSPVLIAPDARLDHAAARVMAGKMLNAGQTCIAPDYVLLPRNQQDAFIAAARAWVGKHYPKLARNPDYTRIINAAQYDRLNDWLTQARDAGAGIHPLSDAEPDPQSRLLPPVALTNAAGPVMDQEIFGPILPVIPYDSLRDAVAHITARPRPLAFYPFTDDAETRELLLTSVVAGGVTVNDTIMHVAQHSLPFGGVGDSGIGAYHGQAGFDRLSHLQPVFRQSRLNAAGLIAPPYGARFKAVMKAMIGR
ncbi:MAG: coniferyl aldehyde dehydrogenase [Paracoccus sp. (in: a-proteobacteria)]|uniref:coniferyl aldehyde dehydrogenase n=1 Tax=Paracoccus sp. TaxID=267 RepID=UPI0026E016B1|nr:coniferyl aldehyde dehydrogenase [Paracoccus sp. (in: a-proteobacteria)]MDO5621192.1 coniferyl aldehyde dehydrogenase [Paracoccus sp. (in: a-proteobacteria)]